MANQQVRADADQLPGEVEQQKVVGEHQRQHRRDEERDDGVVPAVARVTLHVAKRVDLHHQPDKADDREHHDRHGIDVDAQPQLEMAGHLQPLDAVRYAGERLALNGQRVREVGDDQQREDEDSADRADCDPVAAPGQVRP